MKDKICISHMETGPNLCKTGEIVLYRTEDGRTRLECRFVEETLWLSQAQMSELFQTTPQLCKHGIKGNVEEKAG